MSEAEMIDKIYACQRDNEGEISDMQKYIESGQVWQMNGSYGRAAMNGLKKGIYFLPAVSHKDYYGNKIPSRYEIKEGSWGTVDFCYSFWHTEN